MDKIPQFYNQSISFLNKKIASVTGLPVEQIEKLKKEMKFVLKVLKPGKEEGAGIKA